MPKFCQKCEQEIAEGKEGKYRTVTYTTPIERAIYYVCPDCFKKIEQELAEEKRKRERMD
ncbi:1998_t:CDS:2 [Racocetra persica]|uniref:1998_t:CDS:1 n=1 Tax=Racocetra persica TaxID=160502 RepID=A0ACA9R7N9_9GLOM|nr:1998_t:CDS:2 [Racocetra persica]